MVVREITSEEMFHQVLMMSYGTPVIAIFKASWCGACNSIIPYFHDLSNQFNGFLFLEIDVNKVQVLFDSFGIGLYPTFILFKGGYKRSEFNGADPSRLQAEIENLNNY
ncbi:thioredoxin [Microcaecilia unicolor]|uniref:Thioredoxin-like n=1 Tax=Microcaecilia unicolor TaxID=1415580 RepID=A0A6P7X704_9AMPH|nr:thioredoxin-like [Microcaecilia unicolor]